jgi:hypothetical protein
MTVNPEALRYIRYLNFKMSCAEEQSRLGWRLDMDRAMKNYDFLLEQQKEKVSALRSAMPKVPKYTVYNRPKVMYKKDGTLSAHGETWFKRLKENGYKPTEQGPISVVTDYEVANPSSTVQVKDWLFSLGWKPTTFDYKKNSETGEERQVPQVREGGELCASVKKLIHADPAIELLDGLTVINHRLSIFKGFIECAVPVTSNGVTTYWLKAEIQGLTNTLRFKHRKPLVNLPGVDSPYGDEIRGCLIAPEGQWLVGSDKVSLESTTKRHYMHPHDPAYVEEMSKEGFDEHLDLAKFAGAITEEDEQLYNEGKKPEVKAIRKAYKATNYSAIYGVGPPKLARSLDIKEKEAKALLNAYWERNWSVKKVSEEQYIKTLKDGSMWLKNPVSGFYYSLRYEKDIFSTLNQSTGVYCFDTWVMFARKLGVEVIGQFHDEVVIATDDPDGVQEKLQKAIQQTNDKLQLNVPLGIDVQRGKNYADVH